MLITYLFCLYLKALLLLRISLDPQYRPSSLNSMLWLRRCLGGRFRVSSQGVVYDTPLIGTTEEDGTRNSPERMWASQLRVAHPSALCWQQVVVGTVVEPCAAPAQPYADAGQAVHGGWSEDPEVIDSTVYMYM